MTCFDSGQVEQTDINNKHVNTFIPHTCLMFRVLQEMELFAAVLARDMARVKSHAVYGGKAMSIATDRVSACSHDCFV